MAIDLDKILPVSARDLCESEGKSLDDYELVGVHAFGNIKKDDSHRIMVEHTPKGELAENVPYNAEFVVDYPKSPNLLLTSRKEIFYEVNATALIPKKVSNDVRDLGKD